MKQRIRLIDIAEKAGVSKMCVSLALRNDPSISQETRNVIHDIAQEMGYVPNRIAKGLSKGRTYTIAAIVGGELHDDYHNQFLKGATDYAISKGYTLTIALTEGDKKIEAELIKKYYEMSIEGYLIFHSGDSTNCEFMQAQDIPFVLYTKYFKNLNYSHVVCDDVLGGSMITNYLTGMGHRRVAYVYDHGLAGSSEVLNRLEGYKKALDEAGIPFDEKLVIPYDYSYPLETEGITGENKVLMNCLHSDDRPTAIFVCNDVVASSVLAELKLWGYHVPEDISIAGYEGIYMGAVLDPPLTTVSSPIREMGKEACRILIKKIEGKIPGEEPVKISMEPKLTIRRSVARRRDE